MKKNFMMVIAILGIACATLVSCDSGDKTVSEEVIYEGLDTSRVIAPFVVTSEDPNFILVKQGDNLWNLSLATWGEPQWRRFFDNNPFLYEQNRIKTGENGRIIVLIYPGEVLDFTGIDAEPATTRLEKTVVTITEKDEDTVLPWWIWPLLGLIGITIILLLIKRIIDRGSEKKPVNPVDAGPKIWPNGVTPETARTRFEEIARANGYTNYTVSNIRRGVLNGKGYVEYADGTTRKAEFKNQPAYQGDIQYQEDGKTVTEQVVFLEGCANDVKRGTRYSGFRFTFTEDTVQPAELNPQPVTEQSVIDLRKQTTDQPVTKETQPAKEQEKTEKKEEKENEKTAAAAALEITNAVIAKLEENGGTIEDFETNVGGKTSVKFKKITIEKKESPKKDNAEKP